MKPSHFGSALLGALLAVFVPVCETLAQSLVFAGNEAVEVGLVSDRFAIGQSLVNPKTVNISSLDEMIRLAAGQPRTETFLRYGGDFERYWQASKGSFSGKAFEAMLAHSMNRRFAELGSNQRIASTAIEGAKADAADLLLLAEDGRVLKQIQAKVGWRAAIEALHDSKYARMSIVTTSNSLKIIEKELLRVELKAARRGIQLSEHWQIVREALDSGRLIREPLPGLILPTQADAFAGARRTTLTAWNRIASATASEAEAAEASIELGAKFSMKPLFLGKGEAEMAGASIGMGKVASGAFVVLDVGTTVILAYQDFHRFKESEFGTGDYAIKMGLRGGNLYLAYIVAVADPEPITKAGAMVALAVLIAIDVGHDWIIDSRTSAARRLLEGIDLEERKQAVRSQLLHEARLLAEPSEPHRLD